MEKLVEMYEYHKDVKNGLEKLIKDGMITSDELAAKAESFETFEKAMEES